MKSDRLGWLLLLFAAFIYFFSNLQKVIIPGAAFDELQNIFSLDAAGVTRLGAIFLYVYAISQLIVGILADRYGGARVIIAGGIVFCAGSLLSAADNYLPLLCFSRFITGFGAATIYLSIVKEISRIAGKAMPLALSVVTIIGYSGSIAGASPFIAGVDRFGYQAMVFATGLITLIFYLVYVFTARYDKFPPVNKDVRFSPLSYLPILKNRQNIFLFITVGISFGTYFALQSIIGIKFLEDFTGMDERSAGIVMTVRMIIAALNGFFMVYICNALKNRRKPIILFSGFGGLAGTLLLFFGVYWQLGSAIAVAGMIITAFAGNISPIYVAMLKDSNRSYHFGTAVCVGNCFAYTISAIAGGFTGRLMDIFPPQIINGIKVYGRESYLLVFSALALLGIISALPSLFVKETFGKDISSQL